MKYKYPRTYHLPWSKGITCDDKVIEDISIFNGKHIVVTEKMDGECTTIGRNYSHARSLDSRNHPSRDWVKNFATSFQYALGENMRICGENLYAKHSIHYTTLKSYFYGFSMWENDICFSWEETLDTFKTFNIEPVPVLYEGVYDEKLLIELADGLDEDVCEGYVVRVADDFCYTEFGNSVVKYVRDNHVQTDIHWMNQVVVKNEIFPPRNRG